MGTKHKPARTPTDKADTRKFWAAVGAVVVVFAVFISADFLFFGNSIGQPTAPEATLFDDCYTTVGDTPSVDMNRYVVALLSDGANAGVRDEHEPCRYLPVVKPPGGAAAVVEALQRLSNSE